MHIFQKLFKKRRERELPEILFVDKPKGITSYDVIREIKKKYGALKIGHSGTLDPLATGLLILGIGKGTKKMNEFLKLPKTYEVEILLGVRTDTGDMEGKIVEEKEVNFIDEKEIKKILESIVGEIELPVPAYSAIKQGGEPLYKKARRGEQFEPPKKKMEIYRAALSAARRDGEHVVLAVVMDVGSGTYIRSVVEEIGRRLNMPATVKELRRTKIGDFKITDTQMLKEI